MGGEESMRRCGVGGEESVDESYVQTMFKLGKLYLLHAIAAGITMVDKTGKKSLNHFIHDKA